MAYGAREKYRVWRIVYGANADWFLVFPPPYSIPYTPYCVCFPPYSILYTLYCLYFSYSIHDTYKSSTLCTAVACKLKAVLVFTFAAPAVPSIVITTFGWVGTHGDDVSQPRVVPTT